MAQEVYRTADVLGLTPAIDPTRSQKQFSLDGANYIFDAIGPKSAFGNRLLLPQPLEGVTQIQSFRLKLRGQDRSFTITTQAILEWREDLGGFRVIYVIPDTTEAPYRWTWGFLSGVMYFCHPRTGIIFYSLDNDVAGPVEGNGAPTDALAIVVNNGALAAITPEFVMWSNPSDGTNFIPALGGAGFEKIAARIPGYPIMLTSYTGGLLTWTTGGVLRSEYTGGQEVYRHRPLNTEYRPINSFCTFKSDDDTVVFLDERGFFQSKGEAPTPYTPLFNEFLIGWLQANKFRLGDNVRIEWDDRKRLLFMSYSESRYDEIYESAFVLYPPADKWGQFNESHYGILPIRINGGERDDDYFAFVDADRRIKLWQETGSREVVGVHTTDNLFYPVTQVPFHREDGESSYILGASMCFDTFNSDVIQQRAAYYANDGMTPVAPQLTDLDAFVQIGLFRASQDMSHDEVTEIIQVLVRSNQSGPTDRVTGQFQLAPPTNPGFNYTAEESSFYGLEEINYVNHKLRVIATNDGITEYQHADPALVGFSRAARHYSCSCVGIWHIIELRANELGEAFHLRTLELTATSAGRLM